MIKPYYEHGGITIYNADCREVLPELGRFDLLLTDPPYGYEYASSHTCETTTAQWMNQSIANDSDESLRDWALGFSGDFAIFGNTKTTTPHGTRQILVWDKGPASGMGDLSFPFKPSFEFIYVGGTGWHGSRDEGVLKGFWVVTRASMGRVHPNEKPKDLLAYLINKHTAQTILDPFMGSGTTLVAAKQLGRKCVGIELEEKYCEIAVQRLAQDILPFGEVA
jgi:DNA modification methylase